MSIYTRWYKEGTISVTKGSAAVVGSNTYWNTAGLNPGDIVKIGGVDYELLSVTDNTHLTLATNFTGATASGLGYSIVRNFTATSSAKVAAQAAGLMGDFERYIDKEMQKINGKSAYEVAVANGYTGTEAQWLETLKAGGEWTAANTRISSLEDIVAGTHNSIYRGKNLGTSYSAELSDKIKVGNFHDVYPGDRFFIAVPAYTWKDAEGVSHSEVASTIEFVIAGVDLFYVRATWTHHIVVIPKYPLYTHIWNQSGDNQPYYSSYIRTAGLNRAKAIFKAAFGEEHIVKYRDMLANAMDASGYVTGYIDSHDIGNLDIELMSECMVFGGWQAGKGANTAIGGFFNSIMASQFPVFRHNPALQNMTNDNTKIGEYWLRDMFNTGNACCVRLYGTNPGIMYTTHTRLGVRPFALIA